MIDRKSKDVKSGLDEAIENVFSEMKGFTAESDEYVVMVDQLTKLYALKACDKPDRISNDTLVIVIGNLIGIVMIVTHERTHIVTSKALPLLMKLR